MLVMLYLGHVMAGAQESRGTCFEAYLGCRGDMLCSVDVGAAISSWRLGLLDEHLCSWRVLLQQQAF